MKNFDHKAGKAGAFILGAAAATAALGYIFFGSKKSERNRKKVEWWVEDAKEEAVTKVKKIKNLTREKFDDTIDTVMDKYVHLKYATKEKIDEIKEELQNRWDEVQEEMEEEDE